MHVHIQEGSSIAKYWLFPVRLASSRGFDRKRLREIWELTSSHEEEIGRAWNEFFGA